jgi:hypothetical protein
MEKNEALLNAKNFDELLDIQYRKVGTELRDQFEKNTRCFIAAELLDDVTTAIPKLIKAVYARQNE